MKCNCGGNNSINLSLDGFRCECGGKPLTDWQVKARLLSRVEELEGMVAQLTDAVHQLGARRCDHCGEWRKDIWHYRVKGADRDRCWCESCLKAECHLDGPIDEDDDEETARAVALSVVRYLTGRGITHLPLDGILLEAYQSIAR